MVLCALQYGVLPTKWEKNQNNIWLLKIGDKWYQGDFLTGRYFSAILNKPRMGASDFSGSLLASHPPGVDCGDTLWYGQDTAECHYEKRKGPNPTSQL